MAFSRNTYKARYQKETNPVTELTLVLIGLPESNKIGVANQIQHHLKGCVNDTTTGSEPAPVCECQIQEGKVLGLKVITVNTPDVTQDDESNRTLCDKVREFAVGEFVVVMVIAAGSEEETRTALDRLDCFDKMAFSRQVHRYSMAVLTNRENGTEEINEDESNDENSKKEDDLIIMSFDVDASKDSNDQQVQILLNHAKTLVRRLREHRPEPFPPPDTSGTSSTPVVNGSGDAPASTSPNGITSSGDDTNRGFELTIDNLPPEDLKGLDVCSEVYVDDTPPLVEQNEGRIYPVVSEEEGSNTQISFVTANPVGFGDLQC